MLLHRAVRTADIGFAVILLESGADPNRQNRFGQTPLHLAAKKGFEFLAEELVRHGADATITDNQGRWPRDMTRSPESVNPGCVESGSALKPQ